MKLIMHTDGGSRGNPGPAGIAAIITNENEQHVAEVGKYIGVATNNEAEYRALIEGLKVCIEKKASEVACYLDSELVVKQLTGLYKVKSPEIRIWWTQVKTLEKSISKVSYTHIPREKNSIADALVNIVLDAANK